MNSVINMVMMILFICFLRCECLDGVFVVFIIIFESCLVYTYTSTIYFVLWRFEFCSNIFEGLSEIFLLFGYNGVLMDKFLEYVYKELFGCSYSMNVFFSDIFVNVSRLNFKFVMLIECLVFKFVFLFKFFVLM